ncbi:MAG TPA: mannose-1-phosphate guanylyltransferase/mannose-6-phosphate isomerase [Burkholderiales bacterium]|nr:mannose-1-phosphate guanylyltransferase/mannose-6-phosphate isomerase [Burkholderiales bacterium]
MANLVVPVILCGGSGSRLWPMSRRLLPKQFLPLAGDRTLFQDTALRTSGLADIGAPVVVTNAEQRFLAGDQLAELGVVPRALLLEPVGRNTAPAVAAAALHVVRDDPSALLLVQPSDHVIGDVPAFHAAVTEAAGAAARGHLTTFGIPPTEPATGYGYIEAGEPVSGNVLRIRRFVEKPTRDKAEAFLAQGGFYWNSGMFVFRAQRFIEELERLQPAMLEAVRAALEGATPDLGFLRLEETAFSASPSNSVDYAVMERTDAGAMVRASMRWSDVGSWSALWDIGEKDGGRNVTRGDVALRDASGCYVHAGGRHVSVLGARDLVVVETDDAVLVAAKDQVQEVKEVVERLDREKRREHVSHTRVHRPWGYYEGVDAGPGFQVKRLMVKPGQKLSLQLHHKRAEHWVVVSGTARVTRGDEVFDLPTNQSTYIPVETKHRLENAGTEPLLIVEVQSGDYLGEDDIVRFEDSYNRDSTSR